MGPAAKVIVNPSTISLDLGQVFTGLSAVVTDAADKQVCATGGQVACVVTYSATPAGIVDIANNGALCAGTWDSKSLPVVCTPVPDNPATPAREGVGTVNLTGTYQSITGSTPAVVSTHVRISSITLSAATPGCASSGTTQQFNAKAFDSSGADITSSVGAFTWSLSDTTIGSISSTGLVTAVKPGAGSIVATNNAVNSLPITYQTCSPANISLIVSGSSPAQTSVTLAPAATSTLAVTVTDTKGATIPAANIALTFSSSSPRTASFAATTGVLTAGTAGNAVIVASCTPPTCNPGVGQPIYSNPFNVTVTGTSTTTVYATGADATTVVPIDTTTNTAGTPVTVPTITPTGGTATQPTINSAVASLGGDKIYYGTNLGLLTFTTATNTFGTPNISLPGRVLAVSPDGVRVIIRDPNNTSVYVLDNTNNSFQTLTIANATGADWSPDSMKAFITAGTTMFVYSTAVANRTVTLASAAADIAAAPQGTLAYAGGTNSLQVIAVCTNATVSNVPLTGTPVLVEAAANGARIFAADTTSIHRVDITIPSQACPPTTFTNTGASFSFGGPFTPKQLIVLSDASRAYLTTSSAGVRSLNANTGATSTIALTGGGVATTGGATNDGASVYVGATGTNDVQRIDTATGAVTAQIAVSLKKADNTAVAPDFVVVKPN